MLDQIETRIGAPDVEIRLSKRINHIEEWKPMEDGVTGHD
jgi:hypothetical protein